MLLGFWILPGGLSPQNQEGRAPAEGCCRVQPSGAQGSLVEFPGCRRGEAWVGMGGGPCLQHAFSKGRVAGLEGRKHVPT